MTLRARQSLILGTWIICVVTYVWAFHTEPPHDDEYGKWHFLSLLDTTLPWFFCSLPFTLVVLSLDYLPRTRRTWLTVIWILFVTGLAWVDHRSLFRPNERVLPLWQQHPGWRLTDELEIFAALRLFPALFVLAAALWIEKKLVARGLLT